MVANQDGLSPTVPAFGRNKHETSYSESVQLLLDTGAGISVVHDSWIKNVEHVEVAGNLKIYVNASGHKMGTGKFVKFKLRVPGAKKVLEIDKALVINDSTVTPTQILLGMPEIKKYGLILDFGSGTIVSPELQVKVELRNRTSAFAINSLVPRELTVKPQHVNESARLRHIAKKHGVTVEEVKKNPRDFEKQLDGRKAYKEEMRKLHEKRAKENTAGDVYFEPDFAKDNPGTVKKVKAILSEYPEVFKNVVGKVPDVYQIRPTFSPEMSQAARMKQRERPDAERRAIIKKLDLEFQDQILVFPEDHNITITNQIPLLPVSKKDDNGQLIPKDIGMRVVADCKRRVNRQTRNFAALEIDSLSQVLRQAAKASTDKYKCKLDIASAFFQVGLEKSAWAKMGVYHPEMGQMCYTRLPQGWLSSFGWATNVFRKIFGRMSSSMYRYMDDVFLSGNTEELFLVRLRKLLEICKLNGITLKGEKMRFFESNMNFLGSRICDGKIYPSPHRQLRAQDFTIENVKTAADLRKFLGIATFLARHLRRSATVFKNLRKWAGKDGKTIIPWTADENALEKEFTRAKAALKELTELRPYDENKPAYVLVDSCDRGIGAILYQKHEGKNNVVEFFSRKRPDRERKTKFGSCILELSGMIGALHYWRRYLEDAQTPVTVFTDSKSLEALARRYAENQIPSENKVINTFFAGLSGLKVRVVYLAGTSVPISGVDHISRDELPDCDPDNCDVCRISATPVEEHAVFVRRVGELNKDLEKKNKEIYEEEYLVHNARVSEENLHEAIIYKKTGNPFECTQALFPVRAVKLKGHDLTLEDLKKQPWILRDAQGTEKHLRGARTCIQKNELQGPKEFRVKTLLDVKKAYLVQNVLKYKRWIGEDEFEVTPIPASFAVQALHAIHNQMGCMSPAQMLSHFRRHFDCPNAKTFVYEFGKSCPRCVLLRRDNMRKKPDVKIIKPPENIGEVIFVDELARRDRFGNELKIIFATEAISRFGIVQEYKGVLDSQDFVRFMAHARCVLAPLHRANRTVIVRADGASPHTSKSTVQELEKLGLRVEIYESGTRSKNCIPEHDSRCAILSKFLNTAMQETRFSTQQAVNWAILNYNTSITNMNWSPSEIFSNRKIGNQDSLNISTKDLKARILKNREKSRALTQARNDRRKLKKKLELVPYRNPSLNEPEVNRKLWEQGKVTMKRGDVIKLNVAFDKNDHNRLYLVKDINWENQTFQAQKLNLPRGKVYTLKFESIDEVIADYVRYLADESKKRQELLMWAWGSEALRDKQEYDFSIHTRSEGDLERKIQDDSGNPVSPGGAELGTPKPEVHPEPEVHPVEVELVPDPLWIPETPATSKDPESSASTIFESFGSASTLENSMSALQEHEISALENELEKTQKELEPVEENPNPIATSSPKKKNKRAVEGPKPTFVAARPRRVASENCHKEGWFKGKGG